MKKHIENIPSRGEIILYKTEDGNTQIDVRLEDETVWLTQAQMSALFNTERSVITKHIKNTLSCDELKEASVCAKFAHTATDGKKYNTQFYNLDMIISVGYRVNSKRGTQFRIWATKTLRQHLINGYTINETWLKKNFDKYSELKKTIDILGRVVQNKELTSGESTGLLSVISDYSYGIYSKINVCINQPVIKELQTMHWLLSA